MATNSTDAPPLARLTPDDHRAPLWVATLMCLVFVVLGVLTRLYVRFKSLGSDDYIIFGAFIAGLAEFMTIVAGLVRGLGQSGEVLSDAKVASMGQACCCIRRGLDRTLIDAADIPRIRGTIRCSALHRQGFCSLHH